MRRPGKPKNCILRAELLTKVYRMGEVRVTALNGVDLAVHDGEFLVILGPSGSGKSTLLNLLGSLDAPTSGVLSFREQRIDEMDEASRTRFRRNHVGFVFQFYNLIPSLTAEENVALAAELVANPLAPREALERVDLADRARHFPSQLSGGQQQRVAIARALVKRPALMLCDEPSGALDVRTGRIVLEGLRRANRELRATCLVITHNAAIGEMADRVITIKDGAVAHSRQNDNPTAPEAISW